MRHLYRLLALLLGCAILLAAAPAAPARAATAAAPADVLLILDCSGSMWGRLGGQPKIVLAKAVINQLIAQTPATVRLSLMAYGHRIKGDCQDIELIGRLGATKADLEAAVTALHAKGKTPIANALTRAGTILAGTDVAATVVLVSDGLETCGGDPCATAAQLRAKGLKVVIHVVGFDVNQAEAAKLQCIAKGGGGQYFQADDVAQLKAALGKITTAAAEDKPLPAPPQAAEPAAGQAKSQTVKIAVSGTVKLKLAPWVKMPRAWGLVEAESGQEAAQGNQDQLKAKPGEYQILWRQSEHGHQDLVLNEAVRVQAGQTVEAVIDTGIRLAAPKGFPPPKLWYLTETGRQEKVLAVGGSLEPQVAPAGTFDLWWRQDEHRSEPVNLGPVTLASGKLNDVLVDSGVDLQPAAWLKKLYFYCLEDAKGNRQRYNWDFFGPQIARPGQYKLFLRPGEHANNDLLWGEVTVPEHGFAAVPLNSGARFVHGKDAKPPYRIIFVNLATKQEYEARQTWDPLPLPPGSYRLDWWESEHGSKRQTVAEEVKVSDGVMLEIEM